VDERHLLDGLLLFAFVLVPRLTNRWLLDSSRIHAGAHVVAVGVVVVAAIVGSGAGAVVWFAFCCFGAALYLLHHRGRVLNLVGMAAGVPLAFSVVSAVWFVAAKNDLRLLGYNEAFSMYAALHGSVLGWGFVGVVAALARQRGSPTMSALCFVAFALFLCVAFGIDGVLVLKRVGVVGLSILVPGVIAQHAWTMRERRGPALWWALASLVAVVVTMGLAMANELWPAFPRGLAGLPTMVVVHGVLNAVVVLPTFAMSVRLSTDAGRRARAERS
jgi:hypothetical protein